MMTSQQIVIVLLFWIISQVKINHGHHRDRTSAVIRKEFFWFSNTYACAEDLQNDHVDYFSLNVTLNTSASLFLLSFDVDVVLSSPDNIWHYIKSKEWAGPFNDIEVNFMLSYDEAAPGGNCSFDIEYDLISTEIMRSTYKTSTTWIDPSSTIDSTSMLSTTPYVASTLEMGDTSLFQTASINSSEVVDTTTDRTNDSLPSVLRDDGCLCPCECLNPISRKNADQMLVDMIENLQIPKFLTSQTKRKLFSAPDSRTSSTGIGLVGVFVLTTIFGVIVIGDTKLFVRNIRSAALRVHGKFVDIIRNT